MTDHEVALSLDLAFSLGRREEIIAAYRKRIEAPIRHECLKRIARSSSPPDNAFDAGAAGLAMRIPDLLGKEVVE